MASPKKRPLPKTIGNIIRDGVKSLKNVISKYEVNLDMGVFLKRNKKYGNKITACFNGCYCLDRLGIDNKPLNDHEWNRNTMTTYEDEIADIGNTLDIIREGRISEAYSNMGMFRAIPRIVTSFYKFKYPLKNKMDKSYFDNAVKELLSLADLLDMAEKHCGKYKL